MSAARPTVLVLRALGLGDLVTGLPALRLLRATLPDHRLVLAAPLHWRPLLDLAGSVDDVVRASELDPIEDPPVAPALAVDLHGNGPASRDLLLPARPRRVLAYAGGPVVWRHAEHEVARWCRLVREGLGDDHAVPATDPTVTGSLRVPDGADVAAVPGGVTIVHPGAKSASRRWPPNRFAAVAAHLAGEGHEVVVTGGAAEHDLAGTVAAGAGLPPAAVLPELPLRGLAALVAHARLVVSGDTGVAHLAAAYGTPSVTLFGPVSPARWGPPPSPRHRVLHHGDDSGDPHGADLDPALARVTVDEVVAAAAGALTGSPHPARPSDVREASGAVR